MVLAVAELGEAFVADQPGGDFDDLLLHGNAELLDQHDLVARLDQTEQAVAQRLGRAGRDEPFALPVDVEPLETPGVFRHRLPHPP